MRYEKITIAIDSAIKPTLAHVLRGVYTAKNLRFRNNELPFKNDEATAEQVSTYQLLHLDVRHWN